MSNPGRVFPVGPLLTAFRETTPPATETAREAAVRGARKAWLNERFLDSATAGRLTARGRRSSTGYFPTSIATATARSRQPKRPASFRCPCRALTYLFGQAFPNRNTDTDATAAAAF